MLTAVGNTLATIPQSVAPQLKLWIVHVTGSWVPLFGLAAALQLAAGILYGRYATLIPAREDPMALAKKHPGPKHIFRADAQRTSRSDASDRRSVP